MVEFSGSITGVSCTRVDLDGLLAIFAPHMPTSFQRANNGAGFIEVVFVHPRRVFASLGSLMPTLGAETGID